MSQYDEITGMKTLTSGHNPHLLQEGQEVWRCVGPDFRLERVVLETLSEKTFFETYWTTRDDGFRKTNGKFLFATLDEAVEFLQRKIKSADSQKYDLQCRMNVWGQDIRKARYYDEDNR